MILVRLHCAYFSDFLLMLCESDVNKEKRKSRVSRCMVVK